jgi:glutamyl-tRNA synthetase
VAITPEVAGRISMLMPALKERAKTLADLAKAAAFLTLTSPIAIEPKAAALLTPQAKTMLGGVAEALAGTDFSVAAIDAALRDFAVRSGLKLGDVAQPLRVALTGRTVSPGIDATLAALGRQEALARIESAAR